MSTLTKSKFHNITIICELNSYPLISLPLFCHKTLQKRARPVGRALCLRFAKEPFLQVLLVALDHLFDRVTRTTSEILKDLFGCFPRKDLDLQGH